MKGAAIDLGLAISGCHSIWGIPKTHDEIAAYCNYDPVKHREETVTWQAIWRIEQKALRKVRLKLYCDKELGQMLKDSLNTK